MYITVTPNSKSVSLLVTLRDQADRTVIPQWRIKVKQLECPAANRFTDKFRNHQAAKDYYLLGKWNSFFLKFDCNEALFSAPNYALQYYTARTGYIRSFGYNEATGAVYHYTSNQKYAIAFKRTSNTCSIRYVCLTTLTFYIYLTNYKNTFL